MRRSSIFAAVLCGAITAAAPAGAASLNGARATEQFTGTMTTT